MEQVEYRLGRKTSLREHKEFLLNKSRTTMTMPMGNRIQLQASPWAESLRAEYHREGLDQWTNKMVYDTRAMFRCTLEELCAWAGLFDRKTIREFEKKNKWPMYLTLQWDKLRRFRMRRLDANVQDAMAAKGFYWEEKAA